MAMIICDFDGTIIDPSERLYKVYSNCCSLLKIKPLSQKRFINLKRSGKSEVEFISPVKAREKYRKIFKEKIEEKKYLRLDRIYQYAKDFLEDNYKKNEIFLMTNRQNRKNLFWQLDYLEIRKFFQKIILAKEANKSLQFLKSRHLYFIGDTELDIKLGRKLSAFTIAVDYGLRTRRYLKNFKPDKIVSFLKDIKFPTEDVFILKTLNKGLQQVRDRTVFIDLSKEPSLYDLFRVLRKQPKMVLINGKGFVDHYAVLASEFGIPLIPVLKKDSQSVLKVSSHTIPIKNSHVMDQDSQGQLKTASKLKINLGNSEILKKYPELVELSDGIGFLRTEFILLSVLEGLHPQYFIDKFGKKTLIKKFTVEMLKIVSKFDKKNKPVWIRTNDFSTDELRLFKYGNRFEKTEPNPALGFRGIRRTLDEKFLLEVELSVFDNLIKNGIKNLGVFPPMVRFPDEFISFEKIIKERFKHKLKIGLMVETPAIALAFHNIVKKLDFMIFGSNDLTQFTLALDRQNPNLAKYFDGRNESVMFLFNIVIDLCNKFNVESFIGGQAANDWETAKLLLKLGISGLSVSPDPSSFSRMRGLIYKWENKHSFSVSKPSFSVNKK